MMRTGDRKYMKGQAKNFLAIAGVIGVVVGVAFLIPSFLQEIYWLAVASAVMMMGGLILLALAFGD